MTPLSFGTAIQKNELKLENKMASTLHILTVFKTVIYRVT